jgi:adenylate kinase family enzyme
VRSLCRSCVAAVPRVAAWSSNFAIEYSFGRERSPRLLTAVSGRPKITRPVNLARVVVVGSSCSGKTTFAHRLASNLGTECVELDSLYWGPGWTPRTNFEQDVLEATRQPRWVIDGNYSRVRDLIWRRSTAIAWLDYSFARVFSRAFRRTVRRVVSGERLYGGNQETIRGTLFDVEAPLWLVVRTYGRRRREFPHLFSRPEYRHASVIRLLTPTAAEEFLAVASARAASPRNE